MKLTKVHKMLKFKQSNWLKDVEFKLKLNVEFNTKKIQESTDEFNKNFLKLLINCVY